jgi:hypothetical protein
LPFLNVPHIIGQGITEDPALPVFRCALRVLHCAAGPVVYVNRFQDLVQNLQFLFGRRILGVKDDSLNLPDYFFECCHGLDSSSFDLSDR